MSPVWLVLLLASHAGDRRRPGGDPAVTEVAAPVAAAPSTERRRPGGRRPVADPPRPTVDPGAVTPPDGAPASGPQALPDRWRLVRALGVEDRWWDPWGPNTLQGDRPVGKGWFLDLDLRSVSRAGADSGGLVLAEQVGVGLTVWKGHGSYTPPVVSFGLLMAARVDTEGVRARLKTGFVDLRLAVTSPRFDILGLRVGQQRLTSDPRGLLLQGDMPAVRLYGSAAGNRVQFNLAWTRPLGADIDVGIRDDGLLEQWEVVLGNVYVQHLPVRGLTLQAVGLLEHRPGQRNLATAGLGAEGTLGRVAVSSLVAGQVGRLDDASLRAGLIALELAVDHDWVRPRVSVVGMSGDVEGAEGWSGFRAPRARPRLGGLTTSALSNVGETVFTGQDGRRAGLWRASGGVLLDPVRAVRITVDGAWVGSASGAHAGVDVSGGLTWRPWQHEVLVLNASGGAVAPGPALEAMLGSDSVPFYAASTLVVGW